MSDFGSRISEIGSKLRIARQPIAYRRRLRMSGFQLENSPIMRPRQIRSAELFHVEVREEKWQRASSGRCSRSTSDSLAASWKYPAWSRARAKLKRALAEEGFMDSAVSYADSDSG